MTLQEIGTRFKISKYYKANIGKWDGKTYYIHHLTEQGSRFCDKFLCLIQKKGVNFYVEGFKPTGKLDVLEQQINDKVKSYPYDSEYYYPNLRKGIFEELIIHDYLRSIGFKSNYYANSNEAYELQDKNIYGYTSQDIQLSLWGLDPWTYKALYHNDERLPETVRIVLHTGWCSWIQIEVKREVEEIKKGIDSMLKPLLVSDSIYNINKAQELKNAGNVDYTIKALTGSLQLASADYKNKLKEELTKVLATL